MARHFALIPAAGIGARMGVEMPKQYLDLLGRPMIWHALHVFERHPAIEAIHVVLSPSDDLWARYDWTAFSKLRVSWNGGASRAATVLNGLQAMVPDVAPEDWVLVHDAARPCLSTALLDSLLNTVERDAVGGILANPIADTLKRQAPDGRIGKTVSREGLWGAQTPQMFRHALLADALRKVGDQVTDEASAVEALGLSPLLVEGDSSNLKVTYPRDLTLAALLLEAPEKAVLGEGGVNQARRLLGKMCACGSPPGAGG